MQRRVRSGVLGHLEQRPKQIVDDLGEALHQFVAFVNVKESWHLNDPAHVVRVDVVVHGPLGEFVPFAGRASIDGQAKLQVLILGLFQVVHDFLDELAKEPASDVVVGLHENLTQPRLTDGVVLGVELVESVKRIAILYVNIYF